MFYISGVSIDGSPSNNVRRFRRIADLTQAELAKTVGVSRQTIVSIEGSDYAPSVYLALKLASTLETTVEELFTAQKEPTQ